MCIWAYIPLVPAVAHAATSRRWELYRLLSEPVRLRLLALASAEELAVGELAELLDESQPNVSRHAKALRAAGLLSMRKQGRWALMSLTDGVAADPSWATRSTRGERSARRTARSRGCRTS